VVFVKNPASWVSELAFLFLRTILNIVENPEMKGQKS